MSKPTEQVVADALSRGLAGFIQWMFMRDSAELLNELRLQVEAVDILAAKYGKRVKVSARPTNWPKASKERLDLAVLEKKRWSMVGEVKYFGNKKEVASGRSLVLQDISRLAAAEVAADGPRLLIVCAHSHAKHGLWAKLGKEGGKKQRAMKLVLPEELGAGHAKSPKSLDITAEMSAWQSRTPVTVRLAPADKVKVTFISECEFAQVGQSGVVRVWKVERP